MTHAELVQRATRWLHTMGCPMVFPEMVTYAGETPDCIGFRDSGETSLLIECKASRSDFLADAKKPHRRWPERGMGMHRYFMCRPGLIRADELPARWGLLYCHPTRVELVVGRHPKRYAPGDMEAFTFKERNRTAEVGMLYSALNRLRVDLGDREFNSRVRMRFQDRPARLRAEQDAAPAVASSSDSDLDLFLEDAA